MTDQLQLNALKKRVPELQEDIINHCKDFSRFQDSSAIISRLARLLNHYVEDESFLPKEIRSAVYDTAGIIDFISKIFEVTVRLKTLERQIEIIDLQTKN